MPSNDLPVICCKKCKHFDDGIDYDQAGQKFADPSCDEEHEFGDPEIYWCEYFYPIDDEDWNKLEMKFENWSGPDA